MIRTFETVEGRLTATSDDVSTSLWIDLVNPVNEEERAIEQLGHCGFGCAEIKSIAGVTID
jgi:hypothetical protein